MHLHKNLVPIHFVAGFFGIMCIRLHSSGKYAVSKIGMLQGALLWISYTAYRIITFTTSPDFVFDFVRNFPFMIDSATVLCILINYQRQNLLIEALNEFSEIDRALQYKGLSNGNKLTICVTGIGLISLIIRTVTGFFMDPFPIPEKIDFLVAIFSITVRSLEMASFETYLLLLRSRLQTVNRELGTLTGANFILEPPRFFRVLHSHCETKKLNKLRKLHSKLCTVGEKVNKVFSFQLVVLIGITFLEFTSSAYVCLERFQDMMGGGGAFGQIIPVILVPLTKICSLTILCLVCTKTKNEVLKSGDILFELKNKYESGVSKEIQRFCRQILQWNFKFTAFNFFDIDMTLVYEAVTTATTYLTIMIQFEQA